MPSVTIEYSTEAERVVLEQAVAYFSHMRQLAANAPAGTVLEACEQLALSDGRQMLRDSLASAVQSRVQSVDAKKKSPVRGRKDVAGVGS
jgi:hypothetical protein